MNHVSTQSEVVNCSILNIGGQRVGSALETSRQGIVFDQSPVIFGGITGKAEFLKSVSAASEGATLDSPPSIPTVAGP